MENYLKFKKIVQLIASETTPVYGLSIAIEVYNILGIPTGMDELCDFCNTTNASPGCVGCIH